jgi:Kef-type K+ transport system membrane component KefB
MAVSSSEMASVKTASNGVWQGDDPLHFAFPLLCLQALLIIAVSRVLALAFRPLRQPKVIAEIVAGILLGPSALGRNGAYLRAVFPEWSMPVLESVASLGLLFFLFLVGLELDLRSVRRSGRRAFAIAAAGISLPFACGVGVAFALRRAVPGADQAGYAPFLVFMGVALSITAFPVMARILAELKLLTTPIGETALAAAAFNDVAAWVLLALAVAISGADGGKSPLVSLWVLLCGAAFVALWMLAVKPAMAWVARRADAAGPGGGEVWVAVTLAGVLASGFATDVIGIHAIFGAFVFGLTVPKDGEFAGRVTERVEDLVSELLLPLYFASSGLKTDVAAIRGGLAWAMLALVIGTACAGKIAGTFLAAMACGMSARESVVLGVVMNTKGLVELIVLNIGRERKVRACLVHQQLSLLLLCFLLFCLRKEQTKKGHADACEDKERKQSSPGSRACYC